MDCKLPDSGVINLVLRINNTLPGDMASKPSKYINSETVPLHNNVNF